MQDNNGNVITLIVDGFVCNFWDEAILDSQIDIPADAWSLTLFNPLKNTLPIEIKSGCLIKILHQGNIVLSGILDRIVQTVSRTGRTLNLSGRDFIGQLIDCSVPIKNSRQLTLSTLIQEYVLIDFADLIDSVRVQDDAWLKNKVTVEPSESLYDAIVKAAQVTGQFVWFDANSNELRIGDPFKFTEQIQSLELMLSGGNNNILEARYEEDVSNVFNEIKILSQDDIGRSISAITTANTPYKFKRRKILSISDIETQSEAQAAINKIQHDNDLEAYTLIVTVANWEVNGNLWATGWQVNLKSDVLNRANASWVIMGRTFKLNRRNGKTTELRLKRKGDWVQPLIYKESVKQTHKNSKRANTDFEEQRFLEGMNND